MKKRQVKPSPISFVESKSLTSSGQFGILSSDQIGHVGRMGNDKNEAVGPKPKAGKVRRLSVISRLHANMSRINKDLGTWMYGLMWFKEDIGIMMIRDLIKKKLLAIPRFRSYLKLNWRGHEKFIELDPEEVDLEYHVKLVETPMTQAEILRDYVDDAYKMMEFNMDIPLWRFNYFTNVEGRTLLLFTVNHAIGDGVSIVEVLYRMMDSPEDEVSKTAQKNPEPVAQLQDAKRDTSVRPPGKRRKPKNGFGPLNKARIFLGGVVSPVTSAFGSPDTPNPLMPEQVVGVKSQITSTAYTDTIPLDKVKAVKNKFPGATINDILVSLLTMTLKAYLSDVKEHTDDAKKKDGADKMLKGKGKMRASFPINARKPKQEPFRDHSPHNKIALGELRFQFKYNSRTQLVWDTKRTLDKIKLSPAPFIQQAMANSLIKILSKKAATDLFQKVGQQTTAMLSNVPGPADKVRLLGHEIDDLSFALHGGSGLYMGLLSYAGDISCCVCVNAELAKGEDIAKYWITEFNALYDEVMQHEDVVPNQAGCRTCFDKL